MLVGVELYGDWESPLCLLLFSYFNRECGCQLSVRDLASERGRDI